ncbi:MAG: hypothetical protein ACP5G1_03395 [Nanopusillaceae archaeon]|jgi:hypothetical protein
MVVTREKAAENYRIGIVEKMGGYETYKNCGARKNEGFLAVAKCLEDARKTAMSTEKMVELYKAKA